ncbi:MAG: HK97 family phage prohead protease [Rhabdaerophilum sp.]
MPQLPVSGRSASLPAGRTIRAPARKGGGAGVPPRVDTEGYFEGYASLFGVVDLGRDVVMPGAFRSTLSRRSTGEIKLLWQHDPGQPLGEWLEIAEDRRGLFVAGKFDLSLPKARELHRLVSRGAIDGLSIGYRTEGEKRDAATGLRRIEKLDLWEISIVTFPLLPQARIAPRGEARGMKGGRVQVSAQFPRRTAPY